MPRARVVELLAEQSVSRLLVMAVAFGCMFLLGETLRALSPWDLSFILLPASINWGGALLCGGFYGLLYRKRLILKAQIFAGEIFFFLLAFLLSLGESLQVDNSVSHGLSRAVLVVMLVPVCLPSGVARAVCFSLALVLAQPLAQLVLIKLGFPAPTWEQIWVPLMGDLLAVVAATLPALAVAQLNSKALDSYELGNYRLIDRLSKGGMGEVWVAQHRLLKRPAAVKLTRIGEELGLEASDVIARFEREAQILASLQNPHTVRVLDYGEEWNGRLYLVMELLKGLDLDRLIRLYGPIPAGRVVPLLLQCCSSLREAHTRELVHRDIKPANLFLTHLPGYGDFLKVLDFGLASPHGRMGDRLTGNNQVLGTPGYLSPEQISGKGFDPRSDIYSLGCVAFWLLTGQEVFESDSYARVLTAHLYEKPPRPSWRTDQPIPRELDLLVERCLHKDPQDRLACVAELTDALAAIPKQDSWCEATSTAWWESYEQKLLIQR